MPVVDQVAADYLDDVTFVAVAGRSDLGSTEAAAERLFSDNLLWGLDESVWEAYGVFGQPATVLIDAEGFVFDAWFGALGGPELRERLDGLLAAT